MICVIKHKATGKYIAKAIGKIKIEGQFMQGWDGDTKNIKFHLTDNIRQAQLIENPDIDAVIKYGCEAIPIKEKERGLEVAYRIIEHDV